MNLIDIIHDTPTQPTLLGGETSLSLPALETCRRMVLAGQFIDYRIVRSAKRKTLTLMVDKQGLRAQAPIKLSEDRIHAFIREKTDWVLARLVEFETRKSIESAPLQLWVLGQVFAMRAINKDESTHPRSVGLDVLQRTFWYTPNEDPLEMARLALMALAEREIAKRLPPWAGRMGLALPRWKMSRAETRWGSCSSETGLRFSWKLGSVFPMLMDYVIVHELAHLRQMNHSPRFWREVEKYYPAWSIARSQLRDFEQKLAGW